MKFNSYRSSVYGTGGTVATSQPLAAMAGIKILQKGGNAADAAVATAAALNVTEPTSTGIGGDCFALYYDTSSRKVRGLNGSGRAPMGLNLERLAELGHTTSLPDFDVNTVTVPGAAAGWVDTVEQFGTMPLGEILQPAIELARKGFPVAPITARAWARGAQRQLVNGPYGSEMLLDGKPPTPEKLMRIPTLADTFEALAEHGKAGFYEGRVAESIVEIIQSKGGFMDLDDLKAHRSSFVDPISTNYRGYDIFEIPPNGQGITALLGFNLVEEYDLASYDPISTKYYHLLIESMKLAFADTRWYVADPDIVDIPVSGLLSKSYASERRKLINLEEATINQQRGTPVTSSDTVYLSVVDKDGNACSFINSNYMGFGTGIIPKGCGFTLQNRGHNFSLDPNHPNALQPGKRPYHTIIPAMITLDDNLYASYGVMGGFMQPQGHLQVGVNMIDHAMAPQEALDHPRFCITDGTSNGIVALEEGIPLSVMSDLANMGHAIRPVSGYGRGIFGRGQIIKRIHENGILAAGSDPRADGMAIAL